MNNANKSKAKEHIAELFDEAESSFRTDPDLSKRYMVIARKTSMRHKVAFTREQKMHFCKGCSAYLKRGVNSTVRIRDGRIILSCRECGFVRRFVYRK